MRFYSTEKLGEKQSLTPEGFLLCEDVPVARTGVQIYGPDETPIPVGPNGTLQVIRDEEAVFDPQFMASLNGKPAVNDHPEDNVTPANWKDVTVGVAMNPRRGSGIQSDLLIMDIIIQDKNAIEDVRNGKREISLGYDADYDEIEVGQARQYNLMGNHIALVDAGRCGARCAIGDHQHTTCKQGAKDMRAKVLDKKTIDARKRLRGHILDRLKKAVKANDEALIRDAEEELEAMDEDIPSGDPDPDDGGDTHVHVGGTRDEEAHARIDDCESRLGTHDADMAALKEHTGFKDASAGNPAGGGENEEVLEQVGIESPPGADDTIMKATKDSTYLADSFQETLAGAEILVPGIQAPTFDQKADKLKTYDAICHLRRKALDLAYHTPEGRGMIEQIHGARTLALDTMKCGDVRALFRSTVALKKAANNHTSHTQDGNRDRTGAGKVLDGTIKSVADLNRKNAEFYDRKAS